MTWRRRITGLPIAPRRAESWRRYSWGVTPDEQAKSARDDGRRRGGGDRLLSARRGAGGGVRALPEGDPGGVPRRRARPDRHRRLRLLLQRPQRSAEPGDGAGLQGAAVFQHAVGRRRGRRRGRDGQRRGGDHRRAGRLRGGVPRAGAGPVRAVRARAAGQDRERRPGADRALRPDVAGAVVCAEGDPVHARARRRPGGAAGDRDGVLPPRPVQPAGGDVWPAADRAEVRRVPLDHRAVPPLRLLPGERRRGGADPGLGRAGEGPAEDAGLRAGRGDRRRLAGALDAGRASRRRTWPARTSRPWRRGCGRWRAWGRPTSTSCSATRTSPAGS